MARSFPSKTSTTPSSIRARSPSTGELTTSNSALPTFDPATASIVLANQNGVNQYAGLSPTWTNVAPRVGFAYTVTPGTVLRGGFGISYFPMNYTSNSSLKNQPFVSTYQCNNGG